MNKLEVMMNKQEAIQSMREGNKITHHYFSPEEWITMKGNLVLTEDGYEMFLNEFFSYRTVPGWEDGYSIWNG